MQGYDLEVIRRGGAGEGGYHQQFLLCLLSSLLGRHRLLYFPSHVCVDDVGNALASTIHNVWRNNQGHVQICLIDNMVYTQKQDNIPIHAESFAFLFF